MTVLADKLLEARALIDTPEKWTQDANARDAVGYSVPVADRDAVRFCAVGALIRAVPAGEPFASAIQQVRAAVTDKSGQSRALTTWNDAHGRTHAEVLAAFDRAIEAAQATT